MERERQQWHLRAWRKHRGWSQDHLAEKVNTSRSRISELEIGSERYNQDILEALAEALSLPGDPVTPADLLSRPPREPSRIDGGDIVALWDRIPPAEQNMLRRVMEQSVEKFQAQEPTAKKPNRRKQ